MRDGALHQAGLGQGQGRTAGSEAKGRGQGEDGSGDEGFVAKMGASRYLGPMTMGADYSSGARAATPAPPRALTVLGLETSCDETAAAVVRTGPDGSVAVLSSVVHSQIADHAPFGGVVPEIAARSHVEAIQDVTRRAMGEAGVAFDGLDGVAATAGPGLVGGVMVGLSFGKAVALARGVPLIAVNHLEGHAVSARLAAPAPYPFLLLLVSGGHCQLMEVRGIGDMTRLGATIDDAAGEAFDKIAKTLGLGYPGGPALEALAARGTASGSCCRAHFWDARAAISRSRG